MARLAILGAGTAGTILANRLSRQLDSTWTITVVDQDNEHHYQPGYLFIPFGKYKPERVVQPRSRHLPDRVDFIEASIERVEPGSNLAVLAGDRVIEYDWLIVATGTHPRPDLTPGMADPATWRRSVFDFYTLDGATALHDALEEFEGGRLLVHITEMPIKCPVAPLEFAFLADDYYRNRHIRHKVDITYVTPLDGAFTQPVASQTLAGLLDDRSIRLAADFAVERVDGEDSMLVGYDGRELDFDLLVTVPVNAGASCLAESGLVDDLGFVKVDRHSLRSEVYDNVFAVGDAANTPTSKAGAVAHFEADLFVDNFVAATRGDVLPNRFDGHANCFVEVGRGKALLLDFNYETQPLAGTFPLPVVGPLKLLAESRRNHWGKLAFEKVYWDLLLHGHDLPLPTAMSMHGKRQPDPTDSSD